jgi:hypothetical protein
MKHATRLGHRLTLIIVGCGVLLSGLAVAAGTAVKLKAGGTAALSCSGASLSIQMPDKTSADASCVASTTPTSTPPPPTPPPTTTPPPQTGFPNAGNTGVPAGMRLTRVNGDFTTTSNGQTIRARLITGNLVIRNNNVHVTYARILGRIVDQQSQTGLSLTDSTVGPTACPARSGNYQLLMNSNYTLLRVHFQSAWVTIYCARAATAARSRSPTRCSTTPAGTPDPTWTPSSCTTQAMCHTPC